MAQEIKVTQQNMQTLFQETGLDLFAQPEVGVTRAGGVRLGINGVLVEKKTILDQQNREKVAQGDWGPFIGIMAKVLAVPGMLSAPQLLAIERFRRACLTEAELSSGLANNLLMQKITGQESVTVLYGSTAGINFAEVIETGVAASTLNQQGIRSNVLFDYEDVPSRESGLVLERSLGILPSRLRERANNFVSEKGSLMAARIAATQFLVNQLPGFPEVNLIDQTELFNKLGEKFPLGQLLMLARMSGTDPKLFGQGNKEFTALEILGAEIPDPFRFVDRLDLLSVPVAELMARGLVPKGFTFYARDARIAALPGAIGLLLKLTDKANIYKSLLNIGGLFDAQTGNGSIQFPLTRQRIQIAPDPITSRTLDDRPVDPVVLRILAEDQPEAFQSLVSELLAGTKVLTPEEAIRLGTVDRKFYVSQRFNLEEVV